MIGEFEVDTLIKGDALHVWENTKDGAVIPKSYFLKYFDGSKDVFAIKVKSPIRYENPLQLAIRPPQSFMYLREGIESYTTA